jgi:hypothetical protein
MNLVQNILKPAGAWLWLHKTRLFVAGLILVIAAPRSIQSQLLPDPCCALLAAGLSTINATIKSVVGGGLNNILGVDQQIQQFERTVIFPIARIQQAIAVVTRLQVNALQIKSLLQINVASATLPPSQQLEQTLLSRDPNQITQAGANFAALYGPVPSPTDASAQVRNIVDMTDATAQAAMKRSIEIDALADQEIQAADQIDQGIQGAAAGSVPILEAQAATWVLRSQAYTQAAVADLIRVRGIALANSSADIKMGASNTTSLRQALQNILTHN